MSEVPATQFKAKCLELMDRVAERGETYVVTKRGKPVAKLVPVEPPQKESLFGRLRGMAWETGDIMGPAVPPEAWETLKEWDELNAPEPTPSAPGACPRASRAPRRPAGGGC